MRSFAYRTLDMLVVKLATSSPWKRGVLGFLIKPLLHWRMQEWARTLATYRRLPPTQWRHVEKHGLNVVYQSSLSHKNENVVQGLWVVDYLKKTRRIVFGIPSEYAFVGKTF